LAAFEPNNDGEWVVNAAIGEDHEPKDSIINAAIVLLWRPNRA
jgi:hypothetical protein